MIDGAGRVVAMALGVKTLPAQEPPARGRLKVVVTGGHPGDPEYGCGGTVARYSDLKLGLLCST
jgi:LmbE family N-acetylglucosaminyl deacetylase